MHKTSAGNMSATSAVAKVKELEKELERVRAFYTKKVEETQVRNTYYLRIYIRKSMPPIRHLY